MVIVGNYHHSIRPVFFNTGVASIQKIAYRRVYIILAVHTYCLSVRTLGGLSSGIVTGPSFCM